MIEHDHHVQEQPEGEENVCEVEGQPGEEEEVVQYEGSPGSQQVGDDHEDVQHDREQEILLSILTEHSYINWLAYTIYKLSIYVIS